MQFVDVSRNLAPIAELLLRFGTKVWCLRGKANNSLLEPNRSNFVGYDEWGFREIVLSQTLLRQLWQWMKRGRDIPKGLFLNKLALLRFPLLWQVCGMEWDRYIQVQEIERSHSEDWFYLYDWFLTVQYIVQRFGERLQE